MRSRSIWSGGLITGTMLGLLLYLMRLITGYPLDRSGAGGWSLRCTLFAVVALSCSIWGRDSF